MSIFCFFGISKKDAAIIWSAFDLVDKHKNENVHVKDFAATFCPNSHALFEKMFDKYCFVPKDKGFKSSSNSQADTDITLGMDADEVMALMAKSKADQAAAKAKYEREMQLKQEKELRARHRPDYVKFLCFFLFFMSIPEEKMPLWVYWLWYALPKLKATKENIHGLVEQIWNAENFNKSWYDGEVRYIVKIIDPTFNATTFLLTDQRCGGAWTIPFHEMRKEIYRNFENVSYFDGLKLGFDHALSNVEICLRQIKDLRLKGAPEDHSDAGDRADARHDIRDFVRHYRTYEFMPMDKEEKFAQSNLCTTAAILMTEALKRMFTPCIKVWKKVVPKDIDLTMGLGSEGYVRPTSRGTLAKLKKDMEVKGAGGMNKATKKKSEKEQLEELKQAEEMVEAERKKDLVPLEFKYRQQLELPPRVLNHKSHEMRAKGTELVRRCQKEVVLVNDIDMNEYSTGLNIDPIDDDESEFGDNAQSSALNNKADDDSTISMQ